MLQSLRYIFRSFSLPLVVFLLFSFFFLLFFVLIFFVCVFFSVMVNVFQSPISGVSCILANNWAELFCPWRGGGHLFEGGC